MRHFIPAGLVVAACLCASNLVACTHCADQPPAARTGAGAVASYLHVRTPGKYQAGGVQMITLKNGHKVWTKRFGNNPRIKVLLLHGGPAFTHEYMECFESFFPQANIEFYEYDQLGSYYSDQPADDTLWTLPRFVEEVEEVRQALGLDRESFFLLGNSWGGMLAMEYALKYQQHLKGLLICNMTAGFADYEAYNSELRSQLSPSMLETLKGYEEKEDFHNPAYQELVVNEYYSRHILRMPAADWPDPVQRAFKHVNQHVYEIMQGPSEFVPGGRLKGWSVWDKLPSITVPTLAVGARHDTMRPADMERISKTVQHGQYLFCPNGSHLAMWDDQEVFMKGVIDFIHAVDGGSFSR